jgi:hypothetical protein
VNYDYAYYPRGAVQHYQDERFFGFGLLPFVAGSVLGLAASPFIFNRPYYPPPYPPYPAYPPFPSPYGYGGYPGPIRPY